MRRRCRSAPAGAGALAARVAAAALVRGYGAGLGLGILTYQPVATFLCSSVAAAVSGTAPAAAGARGLRRRPRARGRAAAERASTTWPRAGRCARQRRRAGAAARRSAPRPADARAPSAPAAARPVLLDDGMLASRSARPRRRGVVVVPPAGAAGHLPGRAGVASTSCGVPRQRRRRGGPSTGTAARSVHARVDAPGGRPVPPWTGRGSPTAGAAPRGCSARPEHRRGARFRRARQARRRPLAPRPRPRAAWRGPRP